MKLYFPLAPFWGIGSHSWLRLSLREESEEFIGRTISRGTVWAGMVVIVTPTFKVQA